MTLMMVLGACQPGTPTIESTSADTSRIGVTLVATQNVAASPVPPTVEVTAQGQDATPTAPMQGSSACPSLDSNAVIPAKPATFADTAATLTAYLDAGASETAALEALKSWGNIYSAPNSKEQLGSVLRAKVLPGNDAEFIAVYYDPSEQQVASRHGELIVYQCVDQKLQIAYQATADPDFAGQVYNPRVFSTQDVTGDGLGDLSYVVGDCSENTCYEGMYIMTNANGTLSNAILEFQYQPFPVFTFVPAAQGTAKDLVVRIGYVGGPEAGPQRAITDTWSYVGGTYTLTQETKEAPVYRIHALQDGDDAFRKKDIATANSLYQRIATDPSLQSWDGNAPLRDEQKVLAAFAHVRLMETAAYSNDASGVQNAHDLLVSAASESSSVTIYAKLGETFFKAYSETKNYQQACETTWKYAEGNENTFLVIGQDTFGTANYDYRPDDMCIVP
jgi:hypothetical protein